MTTTTRSAAGVAEPAGSGGDTGASGPVAKTRRRPPPAGALGFRIGVGLLAGYLVVAIISYFWTPFDPLGVGGDVLVKPGTPYLFGTDRLGEDVFSRTMVATRYDLAITVASVGLALVFGTILGTIGGYYGKFWDGAIMRVIETFNAFPTLLFAMLIVSAVGPGILNIIVVLAFVGLPSYLRLARAEVMSRRTWQFAEAARMVGCRSWRVAFRHLLPNSIGPLLAFTAVNAAWVALITASLGYLGIGLQPGVPEWGSMIANGQDGIITGQWWVSFFPGMAILGMTGSLYLLGDGLGDRFDPRRRR
jgi:ABC-type dipeptide/oligopeptide/nickel transport system permease subunit